MRSLLNTLEPLEKAYHPTLRFLTRLWLTIYLETLSNLHRYLVICITVRKGRRNASSRSSTAAIAITVRIAAIRAVGANDSL